MIKRISLIMAVGALLIACLVYFWPFSSDSLSTQAAGERAQTLYGGSIEDVTEANGDYMVKLRRNEQTYSIKIDDANGVILSMNALDEEEEPDSHDDETDAPDDSNQQENDQQDDGQEKQPPPNDNTGDKNDGMITATEASDIVLKNVDGEAKKSGIESELDEDNGRYIYEVEIELTNGGEAEAEIDAVTGKVLYFYAE